MACGGRERRPGSSLILSSDSLEDYVCEPCEADGNFLEAWGYCENCEEFLCEECFKYHTKPSITRNHSLLEKKQSQNFELTISRSRKTSVKSKMSLSISEHSISRSELLSSKSELTSLGCSSISELSPSTPEVLDLDPELEAHRPNISRSRSNLSTSTKMKLIEKCDTHGEPIKYYCEQHAKLGCEVCVTMKHRNCENITYIPTVSKGILRRKEYQQFNQKVESIESTVKSTLANLKQKLELSRHSHSLARTAREEFRKEIGDIIDKLMMEINEESNIIEKAETEKMTAISSGYEVVLIEIQAILNQLKVSKTQENECGIYITLKRAKGRLSSLETFLHNGVDDEVKECVFMPDRQLVQVLRMENAFGKVEYLQKTKTETKHVKDLRVHTSSDSEECWITGLQLMPNHNLVAVDNKNRKMKLVDTKKCKVISWLRLAHPMWDVAKISDTKVAATVPEEEKIVFVKVTNTVKVESDIKVNGRCHGLIYAHKTLIVSYTDNFPDNIEFLNLEGTLLKRITTKENGDWLFKGPKYIASSLTGQTIYISNWDNHTIVCMAPDGSIKSTFKDETLQMPGKIVLDGKTRMYITDIGSDKLLQIGNGFKKLETLLTRSNGLVGPSCASYNEMTERLYIGMDKDVIKVFQLL